MPHPGDAPPPTLAHQVRTFSDIEHKVDGDVEAAKPTR
jgi:hypothetical protein